MNTRWTILGVCALALLLLLPAASSAGAAVGKLRFPGGDLDQTPVKSFSIGVSNTPQGAPTFQDLEITKPVNDSSAAYLQAAAGALQFDTAILELEPVPLQLCLDEAQIASWEQGGSSGRTPDERVTVRYEDFTIAFDPSRLFGAPGTARGAC